MLKKRLFTLVAALLLIPMGMLSAGDSYSDHMQLTARLEAMAAAHPDVVSLESLGHTLGGKEIWLVSVGIGELCERPAVAVVGGVSGEHLLGTALSLSFLEQLLENVRKAEVRQLLESVTFYVFPDANPDAREQFFAPLKYERLGNNNPGGAHRDQREVAVPYTDLNNDGLITMMRIRDRTGAWMKHADDERVMVKARPEARERGSYVLAREGVARDHDGNWSEEVESGVFFNRNFSFDYPAFQYGAGENAVSEVETRAVADFLFAAKNVFAVVSFGEANNLSHPLSFHPRDASGRIISGWLEEDVHVNQMVSDLYKEHLDVSYARQVPGSPGDFFQWAYFHYGRFSFSTPGWWVPKVSDNGAAVDHEEVNFLRWAERENIPDVFVPWRQVDHPDFPEKHVEVGGIAPFAMTTPPYSMVDSLARGHYYFITELARMRPRIELDNLLTEQVGRNLYRVTVDVLNTGPLPATSRLGQRVRWVQKPVMRLELDQRQELMSGRLIEVVQELEGNGSIKRSWLIRGGGNVRLRVGSEGAGFQETTIKL